MQVRPYDRSQSEAVHDLLFYARRQHNHLDWYRPASFLDMPDTVAFTAWDNDHLLGLIGCSAPLDNTQWLRLLAVDNVADAVPVVQTLMQTMIAHARLQGVTALYALIVNRWLSGHLPAMGFEYLEDVVTMSRVGEQLPDVRPHLATVRNGYLEHLADMIAVDHAAFHTPWQMSRDEIRHAQRQAASCTVAVLNGSIIGYQITTRHQSSSHLARLAVLPGYQGHGIGALLLHDVISGMLRRSVRAMTVNTQHSNEVSQHLYLRFGFRHNGYDLPVWSLNL